MDSQDATVAHVSSDSSSRRLPPAFGEPYIACSSPQVPLTPVKAGCHNAVGLVMWLSRQYWSRQICRCSMMFHLSCCEMGFPTDWVIEAEEKPLVVDQKALQSRGGSNITEMRQRYLLLRYRGPQCWCGCKMLLECRVPRKQTGYQCKTGQQTSCFMAILYNFATLSVFSFMNAIYINKK